MGSKISFYKLYVFCAWTILVLFTTIVMHIIGERPFSALYQITNIYITSIARQDLIDCFSPFHSSSYKEHRGWNMSDHKVYHVCNLTINDTNSISFAIVGTLSHRLFKIVSLNSFDFSSKYLIKPNRYSCKTSKLLNEWKTMKYLTSFNSIENNSVKVSDNYPYFKFRLHNREMCIIFMEHLTKITAFRYFINKHLKIKKSLSEAIRFYVQCYSEINNVLLILWKYQNKSIIHNDFHDRNILVNIDHYTCHLIDYELLFKYDKLSRIQRSTPSVRSFMRNQNPYGWYYLYDGERRKKLIQKYGKNKNTLNKLINFGNLTQKYKIQSMFLDSFTNFIQNRELNKIYDLIKSKPAFASAYDDNPNGNNIAENKLKHIWCKRLEQVPFVINLLQNSTATVIIKETNTLIDIFKSFLSQLKIEMMETNVNCENIRPLQKVDGKYIEYTKDINKTDKTNDKKHRNDITGLFPK